MAKVYDTATDLITFARGSSATYTGSDGTQQTAASDEPRIEYAADGTLKGLLIEEQRTNLLLNSDNPDTQVASLAAGSHTLSFVGGPSVTGISDSIDDNAVDVFIYDTSKDSDGGAWRTGSLAQASSWYAEASSPTRDPNTRSTRAEFPAVAVIVVESNKVTIYDGDDPSLPMWMVFNASKSQTAVRLGVVSVAMKNGKLVCGSSSGRGLQDISFVEDRTFLRSIPEYERGYTTIVDRNISGSYVSVGGTSIVNATINDVAMTVLPDAPTDPATGLPVPTIAVATDGGVSVINNDGTVYDSSYTGGLSDVGFWADGTVVYGRGGFTAQALRAEPSAYQIADGFGTYILHGSLSLPNYFPYQSGTLYLPFGDNEVAGGNPSGTTSTNSIPCLGRYVIGSTLPQSMGCVTTSSYTTGWMPGDIKLAALADTDTTALSGAALNNTTNYTTEWTALQSDWTINTTQLVCSGASGAAALAAINFANAGIDKGVGDQLGIRFNVSSYTSGQLDVSFSNGAATETAITGAGTYEFTNTLSANDILYLRSNSGAGAFVGTVDSIEIFDADPDRSVNGKGLGVHGSITKTAVATGADVVAYSGFSSSNYLEQPYNPDLDFGQDDFSVMLWFKGTDAYGVFATTGITGSNQGLYCVVTGNAGAGKYEFRLGDGSGSNAYTSSISTTIDADVWTHVAFVVESGDVKIYENGSLFYGPTATTRSVAGGGPLTIGYRPWDNAQNYQGALALLRISATAPTADQIAKIYNDEKLLFQPNAKATLTGNSDAVTALAHDPDTSLLHVGTSGGRSVFYGLRRVNETATAVTTAISAVDGLIVEQ